MGIPNLSRLIQIVKPPTTEPDYFDSILIDAQSFIYIAIDNTLESEESKIIQDICHSVWLQIENLLNTLLISSDPITIILSFDGEGVPMKWPTQKQRRNTKETEDIKTFYKFVLFGANTITLQIENFILNCFKKYIVFCKKNIKVIVCGCQVFGEGEHKIFHIAEKKNCRNPIIVSVDHDVFILALLRIHKYDSLQIYRYKTFYNIAHLSKSLHSTFIPVSILFGNDFVPPIISITPINASVIYKNLEFEADDDPAILAQFLNSHTLKYSKNSFVNPNLTLSFWMTYLWILDYYTLRDFPQLYMENTLFDLYDRNQLLTALVNEDYSRQMFKKAQQKYKKLKTNYVQHSERFIFTDSSILQRLKPYWVTELTSAYACTVLKSTTKLYKSK